jgi:hypothetical protein
MQKSENFQDEELFMESQPMGQNVLTGSGLAIVGAVVTAVTQGAVFDITGGLLTTIGLVMAGFTSTVQRGKVMRKFRFEIDKGREQMEVEVANKLKQYIETIKVKIDDNFSSFDDLLVEEENQIEILNGKRDFIAERLNVFNSQLNP